MRREHYRKLNRLKNFNYSSNGCYFVTFCIHKRKLFFGNIVNKKMILNDCGKIADYYWQQIPKFYKNVYLDIFQIMPNHVHGIIVMNKNGNADNVGTGQYPVPTATAFPNYGLLSKIINAYKNVCTKAIRKQFPNSQFSWQRSFYDRIIRNEKEYELICNYILNNPKNWTKDEGYSRVDNNMLYFDYGQYSYR